MDKDRGKAIALVVGAAFVLLMSCCSGVNAILGSAGREGMPVLILFGGVCVAELVLAMFMVRRARALWKGILSGEEPEVK